MRARIAAAAFAVLGTTVLGQTGPKPAAGAIIGSGAFTVFVENMDRSLAFYHDVFDMAVPPLPASGERPYNNPNPRLFAMFDIPGARERHQSARIPGTSVAIEVMDVQDVPHKTLSLRIQDPGTATLVLMVRDVDAMLERVRRAHGQAVTAGGRPVTLADGSRAVLVRDVDNRLLEIAQPASSPDGDAARQVLDMRVSIAVNDLKRTTHVYRDVLGFDVKDDIGSAADPGMRVLTGFSTAEFHRAHAHVNGSTLDLEFVDYRGVDRRPLKMNIQDRGAARLQLRAQNIDAMVDAAKGAGLRVISTGGSAVPIPPNLKGALVSDPDNFFLTLFEPCEACAPRIAPQ
jgi:catechol 2,3-dioxygenase-like lactoylglutathione lyase family enzyme